METIKLFIVSVFRNFWAGQKAWLNDVNDALEPYLA